MQGALTRDAVGRVSWAYVLMAFAPTSAAAAQANAATVADTAPLVITTAIDTTRPIAAMSPLEFRLSRDVGADEGELVVLVGGVDVTAVSERTGQRIVYRPTFAPIPAGTTPVVVFLKRGAQWTEIRRIALSVLTATGFSRVTATPSATMGNKGQLATGRSTSLPEPERPTYQDLSLNGSLNTTHERARFVIETSSNLMGSSRRQEALRFSQRQNAAPRVDLSDYRIVMRSGGANLTIGHTTFGASRHLINSFGSRGASLAWTHGGTQIAVGALNAAPIVGWDHLIGLNRPNHRVVGASIGREVIPTRPGALKLDLTMLDASMLPLGGFRQGAVLDAEQNRGGALQLSMATPGQRLRFAGGLARSRFGNPSLDPQLTGDTVVRAVERTSRSARFVEGSLGVVQQRRIRGLGLVNLGLGYRHERVDPLYRSVTAPVQADRQNDGADATFSLGAISGQLGWAWSRDNLARLATILTTLSRSNTATVAVPVAPLLHITKGVAWWPALSFSLNRVHQLGDALPTGGVFRAQDLPDQYNTNRDVAAQWQIGRWRASIRQNRSVQDNRQDTRQRADFRAGSDMVSLGLSVGASADIALDVGDDFQRSEERGEQTDTRRITLNTNLRRGQGTSLLLAVSVLNTQPPTGASTINNEQRVELTQPLSFWRDGSGGARGQLFLRYGRSTARLPDFLQAATNPLAQVTQRQWAVSSGLNLRVF